MQLFSRHALLRRDVLAGLMFMGLALFGLYLSRHYPVGTTLRMGTGYVPRLLCWLLLGLGALVFVRGLRDTYARPLDPAGALAGLRAVGLVTLALVVFGLTLERIGLAAAIVLLVVVAGLAHGGLRWHELALAAAALIALCWAIFIAGLGLTIPLWPQG